MIRAFIVACDLSRERADALNRESGRVYTQVMVEHYRIYRKHGIWLKPSAAEKLNDRSNRDRARLLHAHSLDAAQQGFYEACHTAQATRERGGKYPHWPKRYRTTTWKKTGIQVQDGQLVLSLARGQPKIEVKLPGYLRAQSIQQVELVYNQAARRYAWHVTIDDYVVPEASPHTGVLAGDLGEIHPCALSDGQETVVICCRELRSARQYTNQRLAEIQTRQARCVKYSRNWWRLQARKNRFLAQQAARVRDMEHKISHEIVEVAQATGVGTIVLGDVRNIADGKRLNTRSQQKIGNWSHGQLRQYVKEKATACGIAVDDTIPEHATSKTCPNCGHQTKPRGRTYRCTNPACGLVAHRDGVGAVNILSRHLHGTLARIPMPPRITYRYPILSGKRSPLGTGHMAHAVALPATVENRRHSPEEKRAALP